MTVSVRNILLSASFLVVSCTAIPEKNLLKFPVKDVPDASRAEKISAEKALPSVMDLTGFAVLGNELITTTVFGADHGLDVIDLASGETVHQLCRTGRGPGEFLSIFPPFSVTDDAAIVYDGGTGMFSEILVVGEHIGDIAHQVKLEVPPGQMNPIIASSHKIGKNELVVYNSIQAPSETVSIESPYYAIYDYESGSEKRTFHLYDAAPLSRFSQEVKMTMFNLQDCINREKGTVCFVMGALPVFGFLDTASGETKGFRLKGDQPFSTEKARMYFTAVCAQDEFIYALYLGKLYEELTPESSTTVLYKLDWTGHVLNKYELDGIYMGCCATKDRLYLSRAEDSLIWGLYQIDIKNL